MIKKWGLLLFVGVLFVCFMYFNLYTYLNFETLKDNRAWLLELRNQNYLLMYSFFILSYMVMVAASIPGAAFFTILCGFLFGPIMGSIAVVLGATSGAFIIFVAVEQAFRDTFRRKASYWLVKMEKGFKENAFSYLLFLRLIPIFPFWALNIVPALLGMEKVKYVLATLIGIIPGTVVYVMIGNGLGHVLDANDAPRLDIIYDYKILLPLFLLALLSIVPVLYKKYKKRVSKPRA